MIADTLYSMLAKILRGFEDCDAPKIYRHFVKGKGKIVAKDGNLSVLFPNKSSQPHSESSALAPNAIRSQLVR